MTKPAVTAYFPSKWFKKRNIFNVVKSMEGLSQCYTFRTMQYPYVKVKNWSPVRLSTGRCTNININVSVCVLWPFVVCRQRIRTFFLFYLWYYRRHLFNGGVLKFKNLGSLKKKVSLSTLNVWKMKSNTDGLKRLSLNETCPLDSIGQFFLL